MNQTRAIDQTVAALRLVRDKWGALLAAVEAPPTAADWPPRETTGFLDKVAEGPLLVEDREPYALRAHPAPLNLTAHDAVVAVEGMLFDLADTCAAVTQEHTPSTSCTAGTSARSTGTAHGRRAPTGQACTSRDACSASRPTGSRPTGPTRCSPPCPDGRCTRRTASPASAPTAYCAPCATTSGRRAAATRARGARPPHLVLGVGGRAAHHLLGRSVLLGAGPPRPRRTPGVGAGRHGPAARPVRRRHGVRRGHRRTRLRRYQFVTYCLRRLRRARKPPIPYAPPRPLRRGVRMPYSFTAHRADTA